MAEGPSVLIVLGGLPATGKTTIAKALAREIGGVHVRIDSIEQALRDAGVVGGDLRDVGYRVGYAVAEDNLRHGRTVIADSVNPWPVTRDAWIAVARRAGVAWIEVEIVCSDRAEHRRRAESRTPDLAGLVLPTWQEIVERDYRRWDRPHVVHDTAGVDPAESVMRLAAHMLRVRQS